MIANHVAPTLSELDLKIVRAVPPGGNWKDIPLSIPSQRLDQIRASFKRGEGSRSTYYGRLRPDAPSYTINTYFSRPGNGCHIHYEQDRVLSPREAARLQSFPDDFAFAGSQADVATQIGNAVPPLLAYQLACQLGAPGVFVDLFSGAGGLSLGFKWAGWESVVANDIKPRFLETYARNVHDAVVAGDIRDESVRAEFVSQAMQARERSAELPFVVLGGPPCQGFSTAGKRRSMEDERNHLFLEYRHVVESLSPDVFLFENVSGLLNMAGGRVLEEIRQTLMSAVERLDVWLLRAEDFGVPQRRTRVILVGQRNGFRVSPPQEVTAYPGAAAADSGRTIAVSVEEAIGDLPPIGCGEDGTAMPYAVTPQSDFQRLARGELGAGEFIAGLRERNTAPPQLALALEAR